MQTKYLRLRATRLLSLGAAIGLGVFSAAAWAHTGPDSGGHHGFWAGFTHPLTGWDHLAAMLAVGMWSALTSRRLWLAPLSFASLLLTGALTIQSGWSLPAVEPVIAASLLVIGILVAVRIRTPEWAAAMLVGGFALFHGAAHGQELAGASALTGMLMCTALLHGLGIVAGLALQRGRAWIPAAAGLVVSGLGLNMTLNLLLG